MPPTPRIRPYKDFLTPLMHRRFAGATAVLAFACYAESVWIGEWNSVFWSWFPLGKAGIRAGLLFIPAFVIFILRVSQLHVGIRTSNSGWDTFKRYGPSFQVVQTVGWYFFSAYMFSEIYIWSASKDADLNRIKLIPRTDRTTLNEKPVYLTCYLFFLALVQSCIHLYHDYDRIDMPVVKTKPRGSTDPAPAIIHPAIQVRAKLFDLAQKALKRTIVLALASPVLYAMPLGIYPYSIRQCAWSFTRSWAKIFWTLPKSSSLPSIFPFHWSIILRTMTAGFLLTMLWEVGNTAFSVYVAQEPLKNERPITYESRDPNGSLLTGLKGKKLQTRAFAFWELAYIAERFEGRRKAIFEDIDRKGGSAWSQILGVCLGVINGITLRIADYERPPTAPSSTTASNQTAIPGLPRLAPPVKDGLKKSGDLFGAVPRASSASQTALEAVGKYAKIHGQSPPGPLSPKTRRLMEKAEGVVLTPEQKQVMAAQGLTGIFRDWALAVIKSKLGWPFRQEYRRRIGAVVLGAPYGDVGIIVDAIDALTRLAVCSLTEDKYGNVQRDVKLIIQTLTATITQLEAFRTRIGIHWTDILANQESPEVDVVLAALKSGLGDLVAAFGDYSEDLRLSQSEMRMAREAATIAAPPAM